MPISLKLLALDPYNAEKESDIVDAAAEYNAADTENH